MSINMRGGDRELRLRGPGMVLMAVDALAWGGGVFAAMALRFDFAFEAWSHANLGVAIALAVVFQMLGGVIFGLYRGRWRRGSLDEGLALAQTMMVASAGLFVLNNVLLDSRLVPTSVVLAAAPAAFCGAGAARFVERLVQFHRTRASRGDGVPVLIFGAGDGGSRVVTSMHSDAACRYRPVGLVDDDPAKRNLRVSGVPVLGNRDRLATIAAASKAEMLIVAAPSIPSDSLRDLSTRALAADLDMRIVPHVSELIDGKVGADDVRPLTEADLLGRHQIDTDIAAIADYITGRRVLVTGAGGSIGSELCRQLHRFGPDSLIMVDRDESALHAVQMAIEGRALLDSECLVVADIRDGERMKEVFARHQPDVVFHTAALKHLPLLELHPAEAVKTNIQGTLNVLEAAALSRVSRFVNISTDKAADPTSVLGYTKRIAEQLTSWYAAREDGVYLSVRFGNVLGSRGSVLGAFERQVLNGGPITVTHPDVTRYFMTVTEAVQLVVQAGAVGLDGEALVLDMGEPVKIVDVARRLAAQADRPIDIVFTGLRPGEKLHEVLLGQAEADDRHAHPLISHCRVPAQSPLGLSPLDVDDADELRDAMISLCRPGVTAESVTL
ncbi:MAG: nucleoside-diphosphate sugar epimerase/dehydratase [Acidimicrobiales bacterium]|nr:nucleoside-diphosphate sugar epimerase/dehydratase [Acidimicrobiales bacterium]